MRCREKLEDDYKEETVDGMSQPKMSLCRVSLEQGNPG